MKVQYSNIPVEGGRAPQNNPLNCLFSGQASTHQWCKGIHCLSPITVKTPHFRFSIGVTYPPPPTSSVRAVSMNLHKGALLDCLFAKDEELCCRPE